MTPPDMNAPERPKKRKPRPATPQPAQPPAEESKPAPETIWSRARTFMATLYARSGLAAIDWSSLRWEKVGLYSISLLAGLVLLVIALGLGLNTGPGKRLVLHFVNGFSTDTGLGVDIGGIDGSLYGDMTLRNIKVRDTKGVFATSPSVHLDWRPLAWFDKHVDIRDLSSPRIDLLRRPQLQPGKALPKNGSLLPDLNIDIDSLKVDTLSLHPGVVGDARSVTMAGAAHLIKGRVQVTATGMSDKEDELSLLVDAQPDQNKLNIDAHLSAPQDGIVTALLGLKQNLRATLAGHGNWKQWDGRLLAGLGGDDLADLKLTARAGRFQVKGTTRPDLVLTGESAEILRPNVQVDVTSTLRKRSLDVDLALTSEVASVKANGLLDLGYNRFGHLGVKARLLRPERLDKSFTGQDLYADLRIDGAFVTPRIDYDIEATRFGLGAIRLSGLHAKGKSRYDNGRLMVPLDVRLDSFSGINTQVDPLLTNLRLSGDAEVVHEHIKSDNLRIKSDRIQAQATLLADLARGMFQSDVKAGLKAYHVEKFGTADLDTVVKIARTDKGLLTLAGTFTARSTQVENESIAKFLGGNARLIGGYGMAPGGKIFVRKLSGASPAFTLLSGDGTYGPKDALLFNAKAQSKQYGPLELAVTGSTAAPVAVLKAAKPGLGMEIADVVATLTTTPDGYVVKANGGSVYGPFDADTLIIQKAGPLTIDVRSSHFAGVGMAGRIAQTQAGPFSGSLAFNGSGLIGTAQLTSVNGDQGAVITATGNNVDLPSPAQVSTKLHIGRTIIAANAVLRKQIEVDADVQAADLRYETFALSTGRARVSLRGENGTVQAVAHGASGVPFDVAVNGTIAPGLYVIAAKGTAQGAEFHLDHPARIRHTGEVWELSPVTVLSAGGKLRLAGQYGNGYTLQARLDSLDLTFIDIFMPDAGITGRADGAIDFTQTGGGYPTARANLKINNFSRSSVAVASTPVDVVIDASLSPDLTPQGNYAHAIFRQGGVVVGRLQTNLSPTGPGAGWVKQISNGGVSGGIRYNGPAGVLFSLTGQARQQLNGPVAVAADVSGQLNAPRLNGVIKGTNLTYDNDNLGTRVTALAVDGRFSNDKLELTTFSGKAGTGTIRGNGWVGLAANEKFPLQVHIDLDNARLARSDTINSTVTGTLDLSNDATNGALIKGDLRLPLLRYTVIRQGAAEVNQLQGVHHKGYQTVQTAQAGLAPPALWKLDIRARADNHIFVSGMGLESEWRMDLHLVGTTRDPRVEGEMHTVRGYYAFAGRDFNIDDGTIRFDGGALANPEISINASGVVKDVTGVIKVSGSAMQPDIAFSSTPALPQDEVLSRMLFGQSITNLSATEALQLASAVNGLRGGHDYLNPLGALRSATGIDRLRVVGADTTTGRGTSLAAGKYLTNSVYVEIVTDTKGFAATQIEISLSRALSVLSQAGNTGTAVSLKYSKDY